MRQRAQPWLGTLVALGLDGPDDAAAGRAFEAAFAEIALVQRLMSFHQADSDVTRFNLAHPGRSLAVHPHTFAVLRLAETVRAASAGAFDIACAPLLVAWGQLPAPLIPPPRYDPARAILRLEPPVTVVKLAPGWIDLGGIAKGFAVDLALAALSGHGRFPAWVNAGGDLRVAGQHEVGLRDPRTPTRIALRLPLRDEALATSAPCFSLRGRGRRRSSALYDGMHRQPLLAPCSASVRAPDCASADALTKLVLASGDPNHPALAHFQASALLLSSQGCAMDA